MKTPFVRARKMAEAIAAAMLLPLGLRQATIAALGSYKSRGKGEGLAGNKHSRHFVAMDKRAARKARNRRR